MPLVGLYQWGPIFFSKTTGEVRQTIFLVDDMTLTREEIGFSAFSIIIVSTILYASWEPSSWWGAVISLWTQTQIVETLVQITPCVMLLQHPKAVQKCPTNSSANWSTGQHEGGTTDGAKDPILRNYKGSWSLQLWRQWSWPKISQFHFRLLSFYHSLNNGVVLQLFK